MGQISRSSAFTRKRICSCAIITLLILALSLCSDLAVSGSSDSNTVQSGSGAETAETEQSAHSLIRSLSDMNNENLRLGVMAGDATELISEALFPKATLVYGNDIADHPVALDAGRIDGFMAYDNSYLRILDAYPNVVALPEPVEQSVSAFFAAKNEKGSALISEFNAFFAKLEAEDIPAAITYKWTRGDESERVMPVLDETGEKKPLNIVFAFYEYPNNFVQNDEVVGINAEIMYRFCMEAGYTPVFHSVSSVSSAIMGVSSGKYDICASRTVPSEERAETVLFTTRVSDIVTYMIVRRGDVAADVLAQIDMASGGEPAPASFWDALKDSFYKNFIRENRWKMLLDGLLVTIQLAAFSAVCGTILGAVICYLRLRKNRFARAVGVTYVKVFQGTPIVVLLLVLYYVIFGSTDITAFSVCVLGFSLDFSAYVSEMMRSGIETVPIGQKKAALALGYGQTKAFLEIVLPQAVRHILPVYRGQLVSMVKLTSIAGYISVEDLTKVSDIIRSRTYEAFFPLISTAIVYFLLASALTGLLKLIQLRTDPNNRKRLPKGVA